MVCFPGGLVGGWWSACLCGFIVVFATGNCVCGWVGVRVCCVSLLVCLRFVIVNVLLDSALRC